MRKKLLSALQYVFFLGIGIFLIWWQLKDMSPSDKAEFTGALSQANYWLIIPIFIIAILSHLARCQRWRVMMEPMGYKPKLYNTFCATMIGYLANSAVPRLGEVLKCTILSKYERIPADKLLGTIIVERMFDILCFIVFMGVTFLVELSVISPFVKAQFHSIRGPINWVSFSIILLALIVLIYFLIYLLKRFSKIKFVIKLKKLIIGIKEGFLTIKNLRKRKLFIFYTLGLWAMYLLQIYIGFFAIKDTSTLDVGAACAVLTLVTFAMILTPGGIGTFPFAISEILLLYSISATIGKAFGWLMWGVTTGIIVFTGFICLILLPYLNKKKNAQS